MKKIILLLVVIVLGLSGKLVQAQEMLTPPDPADMDMVPPELEFEEGDYADTESLTLEPIESGDLQDAGAAYSDDETFQLFGADVALLESTGTWLRRGFWYTEIDVVVSDRLWRRDGLILMGQRVGTGTDQFGRPTPLSNDLLVDGGQFGAEAVPRMKLGRFLFRDAKNRDHTAEFIVYGGGQWSQSGRLDANPNNSVGTTSLLVNPSVDRGNGSFSGATSSQYQYDSRMNSFELNYHVKRRMKRDRMELEPSGHWIRRAQPTNSRSLIAGIRYINIDEDINWSAFGIPDTNNDGNLETGNYRVRSGNDLFGTQLGFTLSHDRARWSLGVRTKGGIFFNGSDVRSAFAVSSAFDMGGNGASGGSDISSTNLSFLTEGTLFAKWHLRPNFSLRAGLEGMFLSSLALAPNQLNFAPTSTAELISNGNATFLGGSIGFEGYW
ncbi:MAG: BBP7 family outer membrane beta-barrel protein [Planctomycetes bacterium]|nr:BBP7 family outer membrane beta-barrel protein [Planctomycetota bacterium]